MTGPRKEPGVQLSEGMADSGRGGGRIGGGRRVGREREGAGGVQGLRSATGDPEEVPLPAPGPSWAGWTGRGRSRWRRPHPLRGWGSGSPVAAARVALPEPWGNRQGEGTVAVATGPWTRNRRASGVAASRGDRPGPRGLGGWAAAGDLDHQSAHLEPPPLPPSLPRPTGSPWSCN